MIGPCAGARPASRVFEADASDDARSFAAITDGLLRLAEWKDLAFFGRDALRYCKAALGVWFRSVRTCEGSVPTGRCLPIS